MLKMDRTKVVGKHGHYNFRCKCGNIVERRGDTKAEFCGLPGCEYSPHKKTGKSSKSNHLYRKWEGMIGRCHNKSHASHKTYLTRGIKVCDEWKNSFIEFEQWAHTNGYSKNLDIDRIDIDGDYEPLNCRFITREENVKQQHLDGHGTAKPLTAIKGTKVLDFNSIREFYEYLLMNNEITIGEKTLGWHLNKKGRFNDWTIEYR